MTGDIATLSAVPFEVSQETLEALEWPRVIQRLEALCRTQEARQRLTRLEFSHRSGRFHSDARPQGVVDFGPNLRTNARWSPRTAGGDRRSPKPS